MTEKEKMLAGLTYDANYDTELLAERIHAKELCYDYNHLRPSDTKGQQTLIRRLLGRTKEAFMITAPFWCDYGYNIETARTSIPTTTSLSWMLRRYGLETMCLWGQTAVSTQQDIP